MYLGAASDGTAALFRKRGGKNLSLDSASGVTSTLGLLSVGCRRSLDTGLTAAWLS
jgi:hypothetical protein